MLTARDEILMKYPNADMNNVLQIGHCPSVGLKSTGPGIVVLMASWYNLAVSCHASNPTWVVLNINMTWKHVGKSLPEIHTGCLP